MIMYYFLYFVAAFGALSKVGRKNLKSSGLTWLLVGLFYIIIVGLRKSGGDWYNYWLRFKDLTYVTLDEALSYGDKGYKLVSYYINHWDLGFATLTIFCAFISIWGLITFLKDQYNPWLGLSVAVPYLIIVVYMGYMRQGVALGLVMWGLVELNKGKFWKFVLFVILATSFHKSAIIMIAFGIFSGERGKFLKFIGVVTAFLGIWFSFVGSEANALWQNYVEAQMQSQGAMIRVILNTIPAVLLFYFKKEWQKNFDDYNFWKMIALASIASLFLVKLASTAVDRMALYFIPLQIVVYSRLPLLAKKQIAPANITYIVIIFYFLILTVWLNFSANVRYWLPYHNMLFDELF